MNGRGDFLRCTGSLDSTWSEHNLQGRIAPFDGVQHVADCGAVGRCDNTDAARKLRFERALQAHHPDVTIPYWDSSVDNSPSDPLWGNSFLGQFNSAWNLRRALGSATLPTQQQVLTNRGRGTYDAFWPELESVIHNPPHVWVEGVMGTAASPGDPAFYLHHCWIDMLWVRWQIAHPQAPFVSSGPGVGLNDPLMEWPNRTPAMVLDHQALGYTYDLEQ